MSIAGKSFSLSSLRGVEIFKSVFNLNLDPVSFRVYCQICYAADYKLDLDNSSMAQMCGITVAQVKSAHKKLASAGIIERDGEVINILLPFQWKEPVEISPKISGFVYLILASDLNIYKIGCSRNPRQRLKTLIKSQIPSQLSLVCQIQTDDMAGLEKELHHIYANRRAYGEWFELIYQEVEEIKMLSHNSGGAV